MKTIKLLFILLFISNLVTAQNVKNYSKLGDKFYQQKNYPSAIENYLLSIKYTDLRVPCGVF